MRRLVTIGVTAGLLATAQWGPDVIRPALGSPTAVAAQGTTLDRARASVPLPRAVAMAPTPPSASADAARRRGETRPSRSSRSTPPAAGADQGVWAALARCESGGDPAARSANGRYSGAFQFSRATWNSLGMAGVAADHPYEVQLAAAQRLQARSGWGQWPRCSRRLGLR